MINFDTLAHVIANNDDETIQHYVEDIAITILNDEPDWVDVTHTQPEGISYDFIKPKLFSYDGFRISTTPMNVMYSLYLSGSYDDTIVIDDEFVSVTTKMTLTIDVTDAVSVGECDLHTTINQKI